MSSNVIGPVAFAATPALAGRPRTALGTSVTGDAGWLQQSATHVAVATVAVALNLRRADGELRRLATIAPVPVDHERAVISWSHRSRRSAGLSMSCSRTR